MIDIFVAMLFIQLQSMTSLMSYTPVLLYYLLHPATGFFPALLWFRHVEMLHYRLTAMSSFLPLFIENESTSSLTRCR